MAALSDFHDSVLQGTHMIGNSLPIGACLYFAVLAVGWNGFWALWDRISKNNRASERFSLDSRQFAIVMLSTLVACYPPTSGLFRYFHRMVMMPWYFLSSHTDWNEHELLTQYIRPELFPDPWPGTAEALSSPEYETVYRGFFTGLATAGKNLSLWALPLGAWLKPMLHWGPAIVCLSLAALSLQFVVHRQWAEREQLSYPLAQFFGSLGHIEGGRRGVPDIFKNRLFWCGFLPVFIILLLEYLASWYPRDIPSIHDMFPNMRTWWLPIHVAMPAIKKAPVWWALSSQTFYFSFFGIAYFVGSEIAISYALTPFVLVAFGVFYYYFFGTSLPEATISLTRAGASFGYVLILLYTGRVYYGRVIATALGLRRTHSDDGVDDSAIVAARLLLISTVGMCFVFSWMCSSWVVGTLISLLILILLLIISRIVCESGIPFVSGTWGVAEVVTSMLGPAAIGPHAMPFLSWGTSTLWHDPRESLMPFVATGAKIADDHGIRLRKVFRIAVFAVLIALAVAFLSTFYSIYNVGPMRDSYAATTPPQVFLNSVSLQFHQLKSSGMFEKSLEASPLERLSFISPTGDGIYARSFLFGLVLVFLLSFVRFRFSRFPLHPIILLMMGTYPSNCGWQSYFCGWAVKQLIVRFGGGGSYKKFKPLFIGVIMGEIGLAALTLVVDFAHYLIYQTPTSVHTFFLPG